MNRILLATAASALALAACNNNGAANNDLTVNTLTVDNADLGNAADMNTAALGKIAQSKGASQGVKDLGTMLVTDHGAHKTEVAALAQQNGVAATDDIMDEAKTLETKLDGLSGAAFDKAFVDAAVEDHQKDIAKYEAQAKSGDAQTAALANKTLPTLRKHLEAAQKLQK